MGLLKSGRCGITVEYGLYPPLRDTQNNLVQALKDSMVIVLNNSSSSPEYPYIRWGKKLNSSKTYSPLNMGPFQTPPSVSQRITDTLLLQRKHRFSVGCNVCVVRGNAPCRHAWVIRIKLNSHSDVNIKSRLGHIWRLVGTRTVAKSTWECCWFRDWANGY